ncbi:MAG: diaminopimelate epimerase [Deltaproteobacteria bacterium]|nr:diaminopimelate epimerase [Deltaproteobacteria bacterium]
MPFTKMEGLGNDYVYINVFDTPIKNPAPLAIKISDRNFGVGGDGLVLIGPSQKADFRMRMFNADGSEGEMCGNAIRCVGKYLYERGLTAKEQLAIETLAGLRFLHLQISGGKVTLVRVNMGEPEFVPAAIPMRLPAAYTNNNFINQAVALDGQSYLGTAVSMGNPHLVIPLPDIDALDLPVLGPKFEHHEFFPARVNTEFIEVISKTHVRMRVWERGSGETLACGTGACAVLAACVANKLTERRADIELRGGTLLIEWGSDNIIYMTGPATEVFSGVFTVRA